jgi:hypothetical protein
LRQETHFYKEEIQSLMCSAGLFPRSNTPFMIDPPQRHDGFVAPSQLTCLLGITVLSDFEREQL